MAELADAPDLGSGSRKAMGVRLPPFALPPSLSGAQLRRDVAEAPIARYSVSAKSRMKTEFIDVSDTQKNLVVEIPSTVVDAEIDKVVARLQQGGADSRASGRARCRQGRAPAVPRPDPARRRARAHPARGRRGAARARRRTGRHARHQGRRRRRGPAAQVHGDASRRCRRSIRATTPPHARREAASGRGQRRSTRRCRS